MNIDQSRQVESLNVDSELKFLSIVTTQSFANTHQPVFDGLTFRDKCM